MNFSQLHAKAGDVRPFKKKEKNQNKKAKRQVLKSRHVAPGWPQSRGWLSPQPPSMLGHRQPPLVIRRVISHQRERESCQENMRWTNTCSCASAGMNSLIGLLELKELSLFKEIFTLNSHI